MSSDFKVVGYVGNWFYYRMSPDTIPVEKLTHLIYAFATIKDNKIALSEQWLDEEKWFPGSKKPGLMNYINDKDNGIKKRNSNLKTLISVGGWTMSKEFSIVARDKHSRETFCNSVADFVEKYGFDGVDIDWEYPVEGGMSTNQYHQDDGKNFIKLLSTLREKLTDRGQTVHPNKYYEIGIAVSPNTRVADHVDMKEASNIVDLVNVMAYDYYGGWSQIVGHNSNLLPFDEHPPFSAFTTIKHYIEKGIETKKIIFGVPFYGRGYREVLNEKKNDVIGLSQKSNGIIQEYELSGVMEGGVIYYKNLKPYTNEGNTQGFAYHFDKTTLTPYLYSENKKFWITFENYESLQIKCFLIHRYNLGGFMIWELSQDYNEELISIVDVCKKIQIQYESNIPLKMEYFKAIGQHLK
ncbi:hypothetical protein BB560_003884 [Smittium megazygosporum]|uniref:GH18 domain-containing protein n=1 Tax=Smittium megazygosporum TaxID=133381 RepID=A0A2T9ZAW5_9FUNG|nr:hypothetical protein BB560_003884 [Smittium megazygosporum]